jgi:hypothetical protein
MLSRSDKSPRKIETTTELEVKSHINTAIRRVFNIKISEGKSQLEDLDVLVKYIFTKLIEMHSTKSRKLPIGFMITKEVEFKGDQPIEHITCPIYSKNIVNDLMKLVIEIFKTLEDNYSHKKLTSSEKIVWAIFNNLTKKEKLQVNTQLELL